MKPMISTLFPPLTYLNHFLWTLPFLGFPAAYPQIIHQIKFPVDYQNNNQQKKNIMSPKNTLFNILTPDWVSFKISKPKLLR